MVGDKTLAIIKPDAVRIRVQGKIIDRILKAGFQIAGIRSIRLTRAQAEEFYAIHRGKPFYNELVEFMSSDTCMPMVLKRANAVENFRILIGATDPSKAASGTIRKEFAASLGENAIHGSDSDLNAEKEIAFFFASGDILTT